MKNKLRGRNKNVPGVYSVEPIQDSSWKQDRCYCTDIFIIFVNIEIVNYFIWSGWKDSNLRRLGSKPRTLAKLSYTQIRKRDSHQKKAPDPWEVNQGPSRVVPTRLENSLMN